MSDNKINNYSESSNIILKPSHIWSAVVGLIMLNITILLFFFNMMQSDIDEKVDNAIYEMRSKYVDEKIIDQKENMKNFETTIRSLSNEVRIMILEKNNSTHNTSTSTTNQPNFNINPNDTNN